MSKRVAYKELHRWGGKEADNVRCGLVRGGRRILGCGKLTQTKGYWYKQNGLVSSVYLCPKCSRKVK